MCVCVCVCVCVHLHHTNLMVNKTINPFENEKFKYKF